MDIPDDQTVVIACTLNKHLVSRIKRDLATIHFGGMAPDAPYYFAAADLLVGKRHEPQVFTKRTAERSETFWIAEQFQSVSADMFPEVDGDVDAHAEERGKFG